MKAHSVVFFETAFEFESICMGFGAPITATHLASLEHYWPTCGGGETIDIKIWTYQTLRVESSYSKPYFDADT